MVNRNNDPRSYVIVFHLEVIQSVKQFFSVCQRPLTLSLLPPACSGELSHWREGTRASPVGDVKFSWWALIALPANVKVLVLSSQYSDESEIRQCLYSPKLMSPKLANCSSPRRQTERRNPERNRKWTLWAGNVPLRVSVCAATFVRTISFPPWGRPFARNVRFCRNGKCVCDNVYCMVSARTHTHTSPVCQALACSWSVYTFFSL